MLKIFHFRGWTPLHIASSRGDVRTSFVLVNQGGASLEERTRLGETPLLLAARKGRLSAAKYLLDAGADPDGGGGAGADFAEATPLHEVGVNKLTHFPSGK